MTEHPTDEIDHDFPDRLEFTLSGEALLAVRTEAEASGKHPVEVFTEAIAVHHWILERLSEGCTFVMTNPDGAKDTITWQFENPGYNHDLDPLS